MKLAAWQLRQRQSHPLEIKIKMSDLRIRQWYEHWDGRVYVSFSGGMDSTVMLHRVRTMYPDVPAVFVKSLPYPEILEHVRQTDNVTILKPGKSFVQVVEQYGWPVISKRMAQYIGEVQRAKGETATKCLRLTGIKSNGEFSRMGMISQKWQYLCDAPFPISDRCCFWLKKKPFRKAEEDFGCPFIGIRADESQQREQMYYVYGCNAFDTSQPRSWPLAFWTKANVWEYVRRFNVPYSSLYDMGYQSSGCFACAFGAHLEREPNRFQRMKKTHLHLWNWCKSIGLWSVLDHLGIRYEPLQMELWPNMGSTRLGTR